MTTNIEQQIAQIKSGEYPTLTGSDKQVAWAEKIRSNYLEQVLSKIAVYELAGMARGSGFDTLIQNASYHLQHEEAAY